MFKTFEEDESKGMNGIGKAEAKKENMPSMSNGNQGD